MHITTIDSVKYKPNIIQTYFYLAGYYNDVKKDKAAAIDVFNKVLAIDPANADAIKYKVKFLTAPPKKSSCKTKSKQELD